MLTADAIVAMLGLRPLPEEGGEYAETWRSDVDVPPAVLPTRYGAPHAFGTAIYYLLRPHTFSAMHRLPTDEVFHFYLGDPVEQLQLRPDHSGEIVLIGTDLEAGMRPQVVVPGGVWQGARLVPGGSQGYALLGTTMAPGFTTSDYEAGEREVLTAAYPAWASHIERLTPNPD